MIPYSAKRPFEEDLIGLTGRPRLLDSPGPIGIGPTWRGGPGPLGVAPMGALASSKYAAAPLKGTTIFARVIYIYGTPEFQKKTSDTLRSLVGTDTGEAIIEDIQASGKTVLTVQRLAKTHGWIAKAEAKNENDARSQDPLPHWKHTDGKLRSGPPDSWIPDKPGAGSDTIVQFNLDFCDEYAPGELVLGHELIHARRNARGLQLLGTDGLGQSLEERAVAGDWDTPGPMTGNALRLDLNKRPGVHRLSLKKIFRSDGY